MSSFEILDKIFIDLERKNDCSRDVGWIITLLYKGCDDFASIDEVLF